MAKLGRPAKDWSGVRKGRLTISHRIGSLDNHPLWRVKCDCGAERDMVSSQLHGATMSCGCQKREGIRERCTTHGMTVGGQTRVYRIWANVKKRCENPSMQNYERYGGRGIKVCDHWQKFANFYADMGDPPTDKHSIDRIDNDRGYEPENCRWATITEQNRNRRYCLHNRKT